MKFATYLVSSSPSPCPSTHIPALVALHLLTLFSLPQAQTSLPQAQTSLPQAQTSLPQAQKSLPQAMPAMSSSNPAPSTPRKRDNKVESIIRDLNLEYSLGLQVPNASLTPSRRKELALENNVHGRSILIHGALSFLSWQHNGILDKIKHNFRLEVEAESQNWISSDNGAPTPGQQLFMQKILLDLLENAKQRVRPPNGYMSSSQNSARTVPTVVPPTSHSQPSFSHPTYHQPLFPRRPTSHSKRQSSEGEDDEDNSPKRRKSTTGPDGSSSMIDNVQGRRRFCPTPEPEITQHGTSNNTSNASLSRIFDGGGQSFPTQTTVDATSPSPKRISRSKTNGMLSSPSKTHLQPPPRTAMPPSQAPHSLHPAGSIENPISIDTVPTPLNRVAPRRPSSPTDTCTVYSSVPGMEDNDSLWNMTTNARGPEPTSLEARFQDIWPKFPHWLHDAPFGIAWELTRICLHCGVDLDHSDLKYNPAWASQNMNMNDVWKSLREHDLFRGKSFPERPSAEAFAAAMANFESKGNSVILSASLDFNPDKTGPLYLVDLKPLRLDQGCRLTRRFGPDRFFEILIPSPTSQAAPPIVQAPGGSEKVIEWLTQRKHSLVGRDWRAFFTKDAGYRNPAREFRLGPEVKPVFKDRVHFFAESGLHFRPALAKGRSAVPAVPAGEPASRRTEFKVSQMLDWLLEIDKNVSQPHLKLFSRIQLGLSKTFPVVVFEHGQILNHAQDILSPIGKVMNDGIGLMSRSVARKIRDVLGLADIPSAVQGRMGPAKGMWLMDVSDTGEADWISTYPSQRKWECDCLDMHQRTLEVRGVASELKSAGLNLQFLPVFEDRAKDPALMRQAIATRLTNDLQKQFEGQKAAFKRPIQFRQWMTENFSARSNRVKYGRVPFLAGLPESKDEIMTFLLNSGFDPTKQRYLQELAWDLQKQKCDTLRTKLNIKVGRSAYIYMVVDFWGVLEENEVHVGFSSKFRDETGDSSYTLLADRDILVARSPAHFVSDVQKVRAVFKSELHALKDVIVFSAKGDIPLADKLSGGDYDGDLAWVCWDPDIVDSFENADVPEQPDLSRYIRKDKTTFEELVKKAKSSGSDTREKAVHDMIGRSFQFAMQPNFLGICTNFKERLCYYNNSVSNRDAVILSTLVGNLVDQSKQGIIFNNASWDQLRKEKFSIMFPDDPAYKSPAWNGGETEDPRHIIDFLKFKIAKPAIDSELEALHKAMNTKGRTRDRDADATHYWDPDLVVYFEKFHEIASESKSTKSLLELLKNELGVLDQDWRRTMAKSKKESEFNYPAKVSQIYEKYRAITPRHNTRNGTKVDSKMVKLLEQPYLPDPETSYWSLLKASTAFKLFYQNNPKFVWQMGGRQLAFIKAQLASGGDGVSTLVTPLMFAGLAPDQKFVKQYIARLDGDGSEYPDDDDLILDLADDE